jgi:quinol monooxygenase YgiN
MSEEVVVVATFRAKEGCEAELEEGLTALITASQQDEGCVRYALHKGLDDPRSYAMVERWLSRADLDAHLKLPHVAALAGALDYLVAPPLVLNLEPFPIGDPELGTLS